VQCVYDNDEKKMQPKKLLNEYWNRYLDASGKKAIDILFADLTKEIILLASYFKDPSFAEEKEHRIVLLSEYAPDENLKFREGHFSLIRYIELHAPRATIKRICIGSTAHKALAERALRAFIEKEYGYPSFIRDLDIEISRTPYRSW